MGKIAFNYMFRRNMNGYTWANAGWIFFLFVQIIDEDPEMIVFTLVTILLIAIGTMSPKLPEEIFLMPVSRKQRIAQIKKTFLTKVAVVTGCAICFYLIMGWIRFITPLGVVLLVINFATVTYIWGLNGYYQIRDYEGQAVIVLLIFGSGILMFFTMWFASEGEAWSTVAKVIFVCATILLYILVWNKVGKRMENMCNKLADYEELTIVNMPLEKRAKLKEQGRL